MAVKIGGASIDERGKASGGKAGDQTGRELKIQNWYLHSKGWRVFRCKDARKAGMIADDCRWACNNRHIGYDQSQRNTLYNAAKKFKFDCAEVVTNCETDCSALVRVCMAYAGIPSPDFYTSTEPSVILSTGEFVELTGAKYTKKSDYLRKGDILCTRSKGHTVVVLNDGPYAEMNVPSAVKPVEYALGDRELYNGCTGKDVKDLQTILISLGYDCGRWGADGDYGDATENAVREFQRGHNLDADGIYGAKTHAALMSILADDGKDAEVELYAQIVGGDCNVREAPKVGATILGVAKAGSKLKFDGEVSEDGWLLVQFNGKNGWVSGKYGRILE